jgi:hypothetical protein
MNICPPEEDEWEAAAAIFYKPKVKPRMKDADK